MKTFKEFINEGKSFRPRYPGGRGVLDQETRDEKRERHAEYRMGHTAGPGTVTKNPKKLRKQKAMGELGEEVLDEGMTLKDYKKKRSALKQKDKREALKTSPTRRKGIHNPSASPERAARHRTNVDPDFEGDDESNYPGGKLNPKKVRKAKALGELGKS